MLISRNVIVSHNDVTVYGRPARGCPQGGVLPPFLWCLVIDELLVSLQTAGFLTYGYADDVAIIVRGNFLPILKERMEVALKITQDWCLVRALMVNPSKTSAMIFTRKYKHEPIGCLWGKDFSYTPSVKYLGVYLDTKLSWKTPP